jgi:transposase
LIEAFEPWLREKLSLISQKTKLAEAIRYALTRWAGLCLFLEDGRVEIDSNTVERAIRPLTLNRKNALFAGSDGGAEHWAVVASLIETCKLIGVEPHNYLADIISRIVNGHPQSKLTNSCPGPIPQSPNSGTWPENSAYFVVEEQLCARWVELASIQNRSCPIGGGDNSGLR